jgi:hypothetical protein
MGFFFTKLLDSKVLAETPCISTILSSSGSQIKIGHELITQIERQQTKEICKDLFIFSNTNILYCFHGAFELTPYVSHKIRFSL